MRSLSLAHQAELISELQSLWQQRSAAEALLVRQLEEATQTSREQNRAAVQARTRELLREHDEVETALEAARYDARDNAAQEILRVEQELADKLTAAQRQKKSAHSDGEYDWFLGKQRAEKEFAATKGELKDRYTQDKAVLKEHGQDFRALVDHAKVVMSRHGCALRIQGGDLLEEPDDADHLAEHFRISGQVQELLTRFRRTFWVRFTEERFALIVFLVVVLAGIYPATRVIASFVVASTCVLGVALGCALAIGWVGRSIATKTAHRFSGSLVGAIVAGKQALLAAGARRKAERDRALARLKQDHEHELADLDAHWDRAAREIKDTYQKRERELQTWAQKRTAALQAHQDDEEVQLHQRFSPRLAQLKAQLETTKVEGDRAWEQQLAGLHEKHAASLTQLANTWQQAWSQAAADVQAMHAQCGPLPSPEWQPAEEVASAVRYGSLQVDLGTHREGDPYVLNLPLGLDLAQSPCLLIETHAGSEAVATDLLTRTALALLLQLPPGTLQLTIIDPLGLGENFSAFMHLADHDEQLVNHRIWTETAQINARLADLTGHMENVIQTYLRNEFQSITEYNAHAGEVAEPYRLLIVSDFPSGFSEEAASRLRSIVSSGPRCGVLTLMSARLGQALPRNFDLDAIRPHCNVLHADQGQLRFAPGPLEDLTPELDATLEDEQLNTVLHALGRHAKTARRVEVPFRVVAPREDAWWTADAGREVVVALGRAGATKLQSLRLGQGTNQHVLISGKTGSGKSTLLHALITNTALHYSPQEVQFYLIDFKKGVEFKAYAEHALPHARVIAIESEREFGHSVLERLDLELRRRGDLFRRAHVQSLAGYRDARPEEALPRILLVIDEFQEFFVKEDRIAQDAALLLDRLVRQGRAFGIHVLLGSQTLAGAYSLARATIGQMAVRVALQCSASDAHLILSDDNDAARLLRRPGEAIYNDANGLVEGNHPFQVVWLSDHERDTYLEALAERAGASLTEPPLVFEGNVAADLARNEPLQKAWQAPAPTGIPLAPRAWVGEAIAIKEAPAVVFQRRSGANLLVVGQQEEASLGVLASSLLSLAAYSPNRVDTASQFVVFDGARPESSEAGYWQRLASSSGLPIEVIKPRDAEARVRELFATLQARLTQPDEDHPALFLFLYDLARFRSLQRAEDDFGLGGFGGEGVPSAAGQLAGLLRDGPALGMHTLCWSDTYTNLTRWLERSSLRDLEMRVLFQMSATDSSNLMDSSAASGLGAHRAILYSEDQGVAERFRPYGPPADEAVLAFRALARQPRSAPQDELP